MTDIIHAELGASVTHRYFGCPGSVGLIRENSVLVEEDQMPPPSPHALYGTAGHALIERCLNEDAAPMAFLGTVIEDVEVDQEMVEAARVCIDWAKGHFNNTTSMWLEQRVNMKALEPDAPLFGTSDLILYDSSVHRLTVGDWKIGRGVVVDVEDNPQLLFYALGALLLLEKEMPDARVDQIVVAIVQPRIAHPDGLIRTLVVTPDDLMAFGVLLLQSVRDALSVDAPRIPGEKQCRWCPAKAICPEFAGQALNVAQDEFGELDTPEPQSLSDDDVGALMSELGRLEEWITAVRQYATSRLESGHNIPGWKVVAKRAYRKWKSARSVEDWADENGIDGDVIYKQEIRSPAQMEKALKKIKVKMPDELVSKTSSGVTLAPENDPREAVDAAADFAD